MWTICLTLLHSFRFCKHDLFTSFYTIHRIDNSDYSNLYMMVANSVNLSGYFSNRIFKLILNLKTLYLLEH